MNKKKLGNKPHVYHQRSSRSTTACYQVNDQLPPYAKESRHIQV